MSGVIKAKLLGKRYRIGERRRYLTLRDQLTNVLHMPVRAMKRSDGNGNGNRKREDVWALRDINFEVQQGDVVGLIGRNGAGKSTLLKVLSRVTLPTTGWVDIKGRISSLLEVGTGFHGELTGRENVFLNGAILGMSKREIERKFDEIVAFAEVERFIDTPVKHYSSGMAVRLAFAVAAHLEPEILLVDEVLAVGDAAFQKKCLGRMGDVSREGRTILFVSHNMAAVKTLCRTAILLQDGTIVSTGDVSTVSNDYLKCFTSNSPEKHWQETDVLAGAGGVQLSYVRVLPPEREDGITIDTGAEIEIGLKNQLENVNLGCTIYLSTRDGVLLFESGQVITSERNSQPGYYHLRTRIPAHLLNAGHYSVDVLVGRDQRYPLFRINSVVSFEVENTTTGRGSNMTIAPGVVRPLLAWDLTFDGNLSAVGSPHDSER